MNPDAHFHSNELAATADQWVKRLRAGLSASERQEFQTWMRRDIRNARAFSAANRGGDDCDWAWQAGVVDDLLSGLAVRARHRQRRRIVAGSAVALLLVAAGALWSIRPRLPEKTNAAAPATNLVVVRPEQMVLPDGSRIDLKPGAEVSVNYTDDVRLITLNRGTAFFEVAKNRRRPFVVRAGHLAVQAVGTAFAVGLAEKEMTVLVTEGRVRVDQSTADHIAAPSASAPLASIGAGDALTVPVAPAAGSLAVHSTGEQELLEQTGWRIPKLEFSATPLREVIKLMNEHNARQFELADESVGDLRVSGLLRADKIDALTEMLESDFGVRAETDGQRIVLRRAR